MEASTLPREFLSLPWKLPRFHGGFHGVHGSFRQLPRKKTIVHQTHKTRTGERFGGVKVPFAVPHMHKLKVEYATLGWLFSS